MPVFVDTHVLVHARDATDPAKHARASDWVAYLWETGRGRLSMQVLQEYYATTTRKLRPGLTHEEARADVVDLTTWSPVSVDVRTLAGAWSIEDRFGLSCWDALIVASAQVARCEILLTEDLQDGIELDGVRVVDPFRLGPGDV